MLRESKIHLFFIMLFLAGTLFLSACIDYENEALLEEYKQRCLNLTAYDAGYVPQCLSLEECFSMIEKELFDFSDSSLTLESRQILYYYKTHLSKSWYYYNESMHYLKKIRDACSEKNFELALDSANDFRYYIEKSFEESDLALEASFGFILYEKRKLEEQDINMIKEEPIYAFYIRLNDNERQILSKENLGFNNYASDARRLAEETANKRAFAGAKPEVIKKKTFRELFISTLGLPFEYYIYENQEKSAYLPIFAGLPNKYAEFVSNIETTERMLSFLSNERPDEFLKLLSKLVGKKSSLAGDFVKLAKEDSLKKASLLENLSMLEKSIEEKISSAKSKANFFTSNSFHYADENFLMNMQKLLNEPLTVSFDNQIFSSPADAALNSTAKINAIERGLIDNRSAWLSGRITIGLRTSNLKLLNTDIDNIIYSLDSMEKSINILVARCDYELSLQAETTELASLKEKYLLANKDEKLMYCSSFIELRARLKENAEKRKGNEKALYQSDCDEKLSVLIQFTKNDYLKSRYKIMLDSNNVLSDCNLLLIDVEEDIRTNYRIDDLEKKFEEASAYNEFLEKFLFERNKLFYEIKDYFGPKGLILEKSMPIIDSVKADLERLISGLLEKTKIFLQEQISKNCRIKALPLREVLLKSFEPTTTESSFFFYFENTLIHFEKPLNVSIKFDGQNCELLYKTPNIYNVNFSGISGKSIVIDFHNLPLGITSFEYQCTKEFGLKMVSRNIALNPDFGLISEKYIFFGDVNLPRARVSIVQISGATAKAIFREKEHAFFSQGYELQTVLFDLEPNDLLTINYSIDKPIESTLSLISESRIDANTIILTYLCTAKNKTAFDGTETFFYCPIPKGYAGIDLMDEKGKGVSFSKEPQAIKIILDKIPAYSERRFYIKLTIIDLTHFKNELTNEAKKILSEITDSKLKQEAQDLLDSLQDANRLSIEKLSEIYKSAFELKSKEEILKQKYQRYLFYKSAVETALSKIKEELKIARELLLNDLCDELSYKISDAENAILVAEELSKIDINNAIFLLEKTLSNLQIKTISPESEMRLKAKECVDSSNKTYALLKYIGIADSKSYDFVKKSNEIYEKIVTEIAKGNSAQAAKELRELSILTKDLNDHALSMIDSAFDSLKGQLNSILEISKNYEVKTKFLLLQLESVPQELLIEARYMPEFNQLKIANLEKILSQSKDFIFQELKALVEAEQKIDALKLANSKKIYQKIATIQQAYSELIAIEENLKESAEKYLQELRNKASNDSAKNILYAAESNFKDGNYLQAVVYSKLALATLSKEQTQPLTYLSIFFVFAIASFYIVKNLKKKKDKCRPKRVLRSISLENKEF
ncbi:MAG: hypothetical protein N3F05_01085 [Candidatus Diapherotrites archaeon]|nr:hypothetical protein [Candidatus Diapherotrites archaeon]